MGERLALGQWVDQSVNFVIQNDGGTLERLGSGIGTLTEGLEIGLGAVPVWAVTAVWVVLGLWRVGWAFALFCLASCLVIHDMGFWSQTMITLALIISATLISLLIGLPLGIWVPETTAWPHWFGPPWTLCKPCPHSSTSFPRPCCLAWGVCPVCWPPLFLRCRPWSG